MLPKTGCKQDKSQFSLRKVGHLRLPWPWQHILEIERQGLELTGVDNFFSPSTFDVTKRLQSLSGAVHGQTQNLESALSKT